MKKKPILNKVRLYEYVDRYAFIVNKGTKIFIEPFLPNVSGMKKKTIPKP